MYDHWTGTRDRYYITLVELWRFFIAYVYHPDLYSCEAGCRQAYGFEIAPCPLKGELRSLTYLIFEITFNVEEIAHCRLPVLSGRALVETTN